MSVKTLITTHKKLFAVTAVIAIILTISSIAAFANKTSNQGQQTKVQTSSLTSLSTSIVAISSILVNSTSQVSSLVSNTSIAEVSLTLNEPILKKAPEVPAVKAEIKQESKITISSEIPTKITTSIIAPILVISSKQEIQAISQSQQSSPAQQTNQVILTIQQPVISIKEATVVDAQPCNSGPNCITPGNQQVRTGCGRNCESITIEPQACYYTNNCPKYSDSPSTSICSVSLPKVCATVEVDEPSK
jgi:hypothetical protein